MRDEVDGILAYDYGHLTQQGSEFVARKVLLPELGAPAENAIRFNSVEPDVLGLVGRIPGEAIRSASR